MKKNRKKKLPRYWLGTRLPASLGYLKALDAGNVSYSTTQGEDFTPEADAARANILPSAINRLQLSTTPLLNMWLNTAKAAAPGASALTSIARAAARRAGESVAQFAPDVLPASAPGSISAGTSSAGVTAGTNAASTAGRTALNAAGKALGIVGSAYGLANMAMDFAHNQEHRNVSNMWNTVNTNTYTTDKGNTYNTYSAPNLQAELDYASALKTSKNLNNTINAVGTGAAIGTTILPGMGTLIGAIGGGLYGLGSWLFGFGDTYEDTVNEFKKTQDVAALKSLLSEASAKNKDVRQGFYDRSNPDGRVGAAKGKKPVYGPEGPTNKKATAKVSSGEVIGNLEDGYVSRVPGEKNNKDTKFANLKNSDFVISNKFGLSDYAAATGDYVGALKMLDVLMKQYRNKAKNGKLPKFFMGIPPVTNVDTRSDSTRLGVHEGTIPYGAGNTQAGEFPLLSIINEVDRQTNMSRPDSPIYHPNLITGAPDVLPGRVTYTPQQMQKMWLQHGRDFARKNNLSTFMGPNGKMYAKTTDGKVRSFESIGKEIYGETPTSYTPKKFKPVKQLSAKSNTPSMYNDRSRGKIYNSNTLSANDEFKYGKLPKCANGWGDYALSTLPHLGSVLTNLYQYNRVKNAEEYAPTITTEAPAALNAINQMMAERIDPRLYLNRSLLNYNLAAWNARRTPGMGLGGRMVMLDSLARAKQAQDADTILKIDEANRAQRNKGYEARINLDKYLSEINTKNAWNQHAYRQQAHGQKETWLAQYLKNMNTNLTDAAADALKVGLFNRAQDYQDKLLGLYNQQLKLDALKAGIDLETGKPVEKQSASSKLATETDRYMKLTNPFATTSIYPQYSMYKASALSYPYTYPYFKVNWP